MKEFDYPYREGFVRFFDEGGCYYIPKEEMKKLMLEDMEEMMVKYYGNEESGWAPSISSRMPLGGSRKAQDAFK